MAEFLKQGGILTGREERFDSFEGEPKSVGGALGKAYSSMPVTGHSIDHPGNFGAQPSQVGAQTE